MRLTNQHQTLDIHGYSHQTLDFYRDQRRDSRYLLPCHAVLATLAAMLRAMQPCSRLVVRHSRVIHSCHSCKRGLQTDGSAPAEIEGLDSSHIHSCHSCQTLDIVVTEIEGETLAAIYRWCCRTSCPTLPCYLLYSCLVEWKESRLQTDRLSQRLKELWECGCCRVSVRLPLQLSDALEWENGDCSCYAGGYVLFTDLILFYSIRSCPTLEHGTPEDCRLDCS